MSDYALVIDLGGTHLRSAAVTSSGEIHHHQRTRTQVHGSADEVLQQIIEVLKALQKKMDPRRISGIGIAVPGMVNDETKRIEKLIHIPQWNDIALGLILEKHFQLPVWVENDANLAALGEWRYGAGQGKSHLVYITVSTGIGAGVILNDALFKGAHGLSAELGHTIVSEEKILCGCGHYGHLEALASGTAIAKIAQSSLRPESLLAQVPKPLTTFDVVEAARQKDEFALEILNRAARFLGLGIVNSVHLFNPQRVILGGGVTNAGDLLMVPLRQEVDEKILSIYLGKFDIVLAQLGDDCGLVGAASLVFQQTERTL